MDVLNETFRLIFAVLGGSRTGLPHHTTAVSASRCRMPAVPSSVDSVFMVHSSTNDVSLEGTGMDSRLTYAASTPARDEEVNLARLADCPWRRR